MTDRPSIEQQARPNWFKIARMAGTACDLVIAGVFGTAVVVAPDVPTKIAAATAGASTIGIVELGLGWVENKLKAHALEHQGSGVTPTQTVSIQKAQGNEARRRAERALEDVSRQGQEVRAAERQRQNNPPPEPLE